MPIIHPHFLPAMVRSRATTPERPMMDWINKSNIYRDYSTVLLGGQGECYLIGQAPPAHSPPSTISPSITFSRSTGLTFDDSFSYCSLEIFSFGICLKP